MGVDGRPSGTMGPNVRSRSRDVAARSGRTAGGGHVAAGDTDPRQRVRRLAAGVVSVVLLALVMLVAERVLELRVPGVRGLPADALRAAIILAAGALVGRLLERYAAPSPQARGMAARQYTVLRYLTRFVLYLVVVLGLLAAFGVGLSSVVFGGAFLTVIVGLAGQTVFGNLLAGLVLVLFHPFSIGDRISFITWQYPVLMPSFPHEPLMPAYAGTVADLNLLYTYVTLDSGLSMALPNGIVLQAAILNHARAAWRAVRVRFDVDAIADPEDVVARIRSALATVQAVRRHGEPAVRVVDLSPTTFSVLVEVRVPTTLSEDAARHAVLVAASAALRQQGGPDSTPTGPEG
jgi:small-conductance mechanosensitive channel